jgi:hypothetical protein
MEVPPIDVVIDELFEELLTPAGGRRDRLPTLRDFDPLRHDIGYRRERDASRDSMPTLPEIDPLRFDLPS